MKKTKGRASKNKRAQKLATRKRARRLKFTSKRDQAQKDFVRDFVHPQGVTPLEGMLAGFAIAGGFDRMNSDEKCVKCGACRGELMCDRALFEADACVFKPIAPVPRGGAR